MCSPSTPMQHRFSCAKIVFVWAFKWRTAGQTNNALPSRCLLNLKEEPHNVHVLHPDYAICLERERGFNYRAVHELWLATEDPCWQACARSYKQSVLMGGGGSSYRELGTGVKVLRPSVPAVPMASTKSVLHWVMNPSWLACVPIIHDLGHLIRGTFFQRVSDTRCLGRAVMSADTGVRPSLERA